MSNEFSPEAGLSRRNAIKILASAASLSALRLPMSSVQAASISEQPSGSALPAGTPLPPMKGLWHGAAYYPELWPDSEIDRDIAIMQEVGINLVRIGEFAWSKMEPDEGHISLEYFVRVMDKLHAAGISTVFCTPTATPPIWLTYQHPERCFVDANGVTMIHGARQHASYDHPDVQAACWKIVEACAHALGKHPGLVGWQIDNELKCHVAEDFSAASEARWHKWLEQRYGTIEKLNDAWGAEIWSQRYQKFEQVPAPRKTPFAHNASLSTAYLQFSREAIAEFQATQCAIIRKYSTAPITHNFSLGFAVSFERMCQDLDFASFDNYSPADKYNMIVLNCDLFRAAKPGRPFWVMETSCTHNGWLKSYETPHSPGYLVAEALACYGLGAQAFNYWLWRQQRTGCELPHSAVISAWGRPSVGFEAVKDVEKARRALLPVFEQTSPAPAEAALTWSDRGRTFLITEPLGENSEYKLDFRQQMSAWHERLMDAGLPRDVRFENATLDGLKLLVTPLMPYVSDAFRERVQAFVEAGGVWICGPLTGTRTGEHTVPTDAGLGALDALGGVETVFSFPVTGTGATGEFQGLSAPLSGWCQAFRPNHADAKAVGALKCDRAPGFAFITERKLGKGLVVMLGAQPQADAGAVLLTQLLAHYAERAGAKRIISSKGTLVCPRVSKDGRVLWLAINLDGRGGQVELPRSAKDAVSGASLPAGALKLARYEHRAVWI
ncbi:MAG: beta-galactosidase [Nibricoccus sp.]